MRKDQLIRALSSLATIAFQEWFQEEEGSPGGGGCRAAKKAGKRCRGSLPRRGAAPRPVTWEREVRTTRSIMLARRTGSSF